MGCWEVHKHSEKEPAQKDDDEVMSIGVIRMDDGGEQLYANTQ